MRGTKYSLAKLRELPVVSTLSSCSGCRPALIASGSTSQNAAMLTS